MPRKEFYIGWSDKNNDTLRNYLKKPFALILMILPVIVLTVSYFQKSSNNHLFEFGNLRQVSGVYYDYPVPMLIANKETIPDGVNPNILLVGYGKFGAKGIMAKIEAKLGPLHRTQVMLEGTLIYGDGRTLLELKEDNPLIDGEGGGGMRAISNQYHTKVLEGEILDPKCYFGVMKPAEGKIHKSCAIRCISGGIPPVLRTKETGGGYQYYIMVSNDRSKDINQEVLDYVAEKISIKGDVSVWQGWHVLFLDAKDIKRMP